MNKFGICDKCKATNIKSLIPKLKNIDDKAIINIGCQNVCGIGRNKPFVICNDRLIIADNLDELITKVKQAINS